MPAASAESVTSTTASVVRNQGTNTSAGTAAMATPPALSAREVLSQVRKVRSLARVKRGSGSMRERYFAAILPRDMGLITAVVRISVLTLSRKHGPDRRTDRLLVAGRWFPSSKTCSSCGAVKTKLPLRVRTYVCEGCGLSMDRDENTALNLASLVERTVAGRGPETINGRGADRKTPPGGAGGRETSTPHRTSTARIRRGPSPAPGESLTTLETQ